MHLIQCTNHYTNLPMHQTINNCTSTQQCCNLSIKSDLKYSLNAHVDHMHQIHQCCQTIPITLHILGFTLDRTTTQILCTPVHLIHSKHFTFIDLFHPHMNLTLHTFNPYSIDSKCTDKTYNYSPPYVGKLLTHRYTMTHTQALCALCLDTLN